MRAPKAGRLTRSQKIAEARGSRDGVKVVKGVPADPATEAWYTRQLTTFVAAMRRDIEKVLVAQVRQKEELFTRDSKRTRIVLAVLDSFVDDFAASIKLLRDRWTLGNLAALRLASGFVGRMDAATKTKLEKGVGKAMGVDVAQIAKSEGLTTALDASIRSNVQLIQSIPAEYLDKIERIINTETIKRRSGTSIIEQIRAVYPVTESRARFIARDQSAKVNGDITRERQTATGVRGYRWRTVGDGAVRESHKERNGKVYAWNPEDVGKRLDSGEVMLDPEADDIGHPGEDYQCRCEAEAILELDRLI